MLSAEIKIQIKVPDNLPQLLRRKDACQLLGVNKDAYYIVTKGYRVRPPGYTQEMLPKSHLVALIALRTSKSVPTR